MQLIKCDPVYAGTNFFLGGLVKNRAGEYLLQEDVVSIKLQVTDFDTDEEVATEDLVVADTVFDVLQTDGRISTHPAGYNFLHETSPAQTPAAKKTYVFLYRFTDPDGQVFDVGFKVPTIQKKFTPAP